MTLWVKDWKMWVDFCAVVVRVSAGLYLRSRQTYRQTDRQMDIQTDKQTHTVTDLLIYMPICIIFIYWY